MKYFIFKYLKVKKKDVDVQKCQIYAKPHEHYLKKCGNIKIDIYEIQNYANNV